MSLSFPDGWPDECPPSDADDASGEVYRIVNNNPPLSVDLATHDELGKMPNACQCLRRGISVFRDMKDAVHQRQLFPRIGKMIAKADLQPCHGKTKLTSGKMPTHTTWWAFESVNRSDMYSVVPEEL